MTKEELIAILSKIDDSDGNLRIKVYSEVHQIYLPLEDVVVGVDNIRLKTL